MWDFFIQFCLVEMSHLIIFCLKMSYEISSEIEQEKDLMEILRRVVCDISVYINIYMYKHNRTNIFHC